MQHWLTLLMHDQQRVGLVCVQEQLGHGQSKRCAWWFYHPLRRSIAEQQTPAKKFWRRGSCSKRPNFPGQYPVLLDNQSAIALACGPSSHHQRTKHIATKYHYQRQLLLQGIVRFQHQATQVQIADMLTKDLGSKAHRRHRDVIFGKTAIEIMHCKKTTGQLQDASDQT
jgi:hypothetical protein